MTPPPARKTVSRWLSGRFGALILFLGISLILSLATRLALLELARHDVTWDLSLIAAFGWGLLYDLGAAAWLSLPLIVILTILPANAFHNRWIRLGFFVLVFAMLNLMAFGAICEWFFWDEFGVRFNFIAVDYLAYTSEVLGNIWESYPMPLILTGIVSGSALSFWLIHRTGLPAIWLQSEHSSIRKRLSTGILCFATALSFGLILSSHWLPRFHNNFNRELAQNGTWALFAAYFSNELPYGEFYTTLPQVSAFANLREELVEDGSVLTNPESEDSLRSIVNPGPELHPNIIQITVESLSAEFLGIFNPESDWTPHLDELASKSLLFDNFYATGTRTVRGMEALTLSLPPTPGRSIVKRPHNENLFSLGSILRTRGYENAFIYSGHGYFDNMNYFFAHNGYRVIDRSDVADGDITFANVWGACDEDLFRWTMREADTVHESGKPFHFFVMTTSNHRPFTYPDGRIDLPSKASGRAGGVKYTDFAIDRFIREASAKPWFKDTVFVIVADHCGSSAGRTDVPLRNYHIPLIIYAPGGQIAPGHITTLSSQMDYAPTLLGLLNWSYPSRFFGHDVRRVDPAEAHALVGNYQKLGHLEAGELTVLKPMRENVAFSIDMKSFAQIPKDPTEYGTNEAVSFYQTASYMFHNGLYNALTPQEISEFATPGAIADQPGNVATLSSN
ncbi:MAG: sulfatase-like hydrolase/transferase [Opitutaceae bacterium]